jgi:hypothetical protein
MATVFWVEQGIIILLKFLARGTTVNSDHYNETIRSLNAHLCQVYPIRKMSEVLLLP